MRTRAAGVVCALVAGGALGAIEAGLWLNVLATPESPWMSVLRWMRTHSWLPCLLVLGNASASWLLLSRAPIRSMLHAAPGLLRLLAAGVGYFALIRSASALSGAGWPLLVPLCAGFAAVVALLAWLFQSSDRGFASAARAGIVGAGAFLAVILCGGPLRDAPWTSLGGIGVFAAAAAPPLLRVHPTPGPAVASGALLGSLAALAFLRASDFRFAGRAGRRLLLGACWGAAASGLLYLAHATQLTRVFASAYSEAEAVRISLLTDAMLAVTALLAAAAMAGSLRWIRVAAVAAICAVAAGAFLYNWDARNGSALYLRALRTYPYRSGVYLHFGGDGWSRTAQFRSDDSKIALCDALLRRYPRNCRRADALLLKAAAEFEDWRFSDCEQTLKRLAREYPESRGSSSVLLFQALAVQGRHREAASVRPARDWVFEAWRRRPGAAQVAHSLLAAGDSRAALGYDTFYVDHVRFQCSGIWRTGVVCSAESRIERILFGAPSPRLCTVTGRIIRGSVPVAGARVALVQPLVDASSPADSTQFVGARTLPLWHGAAALTDSEGRFRMQGVPEGRYELVAGFEPPVVPDGWVFAEPTSPVTVAPPACELPQIRLVPAVRTLRPADGERLKGRPRFSWLAYPSAAFYSVAIISDRAGASAEAGGRPADLYTCWTATHIRRAEVEMDGEGFRPGPFSADEYRNGALVPGRTYMWIVCAYDAKGRLLSSSEHYRVGREPSFTVETAAPAQGGGSLQKAYPGNPFSEVAR